MPTYSSDLERDFPLMQMVMTLVTERQEIVQGIFSALSIEIRYGELPSEHCVFRSAGTCSHHASDRQCAGSHPVVLDLDTDFL